MRFQASVEFLVLGLGALLLTLSVGTTLVDSLQTLSAEVKETPQGKKVVYPSEVLKKNPSISRMEVTPLSPYDDERVTFFCEGPEMRRVSLYLNNSLIKSCNSSSCSAQKDNLTPGDYTFTCRVWDEKGNSEDASIRFYVRRRPDTVPPVITGLTISGYQNNVTISCHATDDRGLKYVAIFLDNSKIKECTGGTVDNPKTVVECTVSKTLSKGSYNIECEAVDMANQINPDYPPNITRRGQRITIPFEPPKKSNTPEVTATKGSVTLSLRITPIEGAYIDKDVIRIGCAATSEDPGEKIRYMTITDYSYRKGINRVLQSWSGSSTSQYISYAGTFTVPWYHKIRCVALTSRGNYLVAEQTIHVYGREPKITLTSKRNGSSPGWRGRANETTFSITCKVNDPAGIRRAYLKVGGRTIDEIRNDECDYEKLSPEGITQCPTEKTFTYSGTFSSDRRVECVAIDVYGKKSIVSNTVDVCTDTCRYYSIGYEKCASTTRINRCEWEWGGVKPSEPEQFNCKVWRPFKSCDAETAKVLDSCSGTANECVNMNFTTWTCKKRECVRYKETLYEYEGQRCVDNDGDADCKPYTYYKTTTCYSKHFLGSGYCERTTYYYRPWNKPSCSYSC